MFEQIITDLKAAGLTEKEIAERVGSSQSSINRFHRGKHEPLYSVGAEIVKLHAEKCARQAASS